MKRFQYFTLVTLLSLASPGTQFALAQGTTGPHGEQATPSSAVVLSDKEVAEIKAGGYTAAFAWHTSSDYTTAVTAGATDEFERLGITIVATTDAGYDAARQRNDVETIMAKAPSIIISLPVDPVTSAEIFRTARDAGVQLVFIDNTPDGFVQGKDFVTVVTDDLYQMGKQAADALAAALNSKGNVAWIYHDAEFYVTNQRDNAFKTTIETDYPDMKIVDTAGIADPARAEEIAQALLSKNPDLDGIYVTWAEPAEGVLATLRSFGNTTTKLVTLDLSEPMALDMVKGGNTVAIVADEAYELGRTAATAAAYGLLKKKIPPFIVAPALTVTKENVEQGWQTSLHRDAPPIVLESLR